MSNIYYDGLTGMAKNPVYGHVCLEAPQNDQKPLKMAISGTFKHPSQT